MKNGRYTPGPWIVYGGTGIRPHNSGVLVATVRENLPLGYHDANAAIIALAPEMFECLAELLHASKSFGQNPMLLATALLKARNIVNRGPKP